MNMKECPNCAGVVEDLTFVPLPWQGEGVFWCVPCRDYLWRKA